MSERRFPWRTLLFLSLAANLLIVGAVAGALGAGVRLQRDDPRAVVERMPGPRAFLAALPPEIRVKMRRELAASWEESRALRQAALQARRDAFAATAAEPYDQAGVVAAFERLRAADQAAIAVFHDNVARAFGELSPEDRRAALQALRDAAPARRDSVAPADDGESGESLRDRRRERLERWRERRRQREQNAP